MAEETGERAVSADKFHSGEGAPVRLQDMVIIDGTEVANRALRRAEEIGSQQGTSTDLERSGE